MSLVDKIDKTNNTPEVRVPKVPRTDSNVSQTPHY